MCACLLSRAPCVHACTITVPFPCHSRLHHQRQSGDRVLWGSLWRQLRAVFRGVGGGEEAQNGRPSEVDSPPSEQMVAWTSTRSEPSTQQPIPDILSLNSNALTEFRSILSVKRIRVKGSPPPPAAAPEGVGWPLRDFVQIVLQIKVVGLVSLCTNLFAN